MICPNCGREILKNYCPSCNLILTAESDFLETESKQPLRAPKPERKQRHRNSKGKTTTKKVLKKKVEKRTERRPQSTPREKTVRLHETPGPRQIFGNDNTFSGQSSGNSKSQGAAVLLIAASRVMQLICCLLMAAMVWTTGFSFFHNARQLGSPSLILAEKNYSLALYGSFTVVSLLMGLLWCLWILSKKGAGGQVRMRKYDVGRGFLPFLLCIALTLLSEATLPFIPAEEGAWKGMAAGVSFYLDTIGRHQSFLLSCGVCGFILSLVRKTLRV